MQGIDGHRRGADPRLVGLALAVTAIVVLSARAAQAHDYENPGKNGARLSVETFSDGTIAPLSPNQVVRGINFVANATVEIFQCPSAGPTDPRTQCTLAGKADSAVDGSFQTQVSLSAGMPAQDTYCAPVGTSQCYLVAGTYDLVSGQAMSDAEHDLCFNQDFAWLYFPTAYYPERIASEKCAGPPEPIVSTTTTVPPARWQAGAPLSVARESLAAAVGADGAIYALGGAKAGTRALSVAERMDPCGSRTWSPIAPLLTPRANFTAATGPDGRVYAIGGVDATGTALASVDAYDPSTNTWSPVASLDCHEPTLPPRPVPTVASTRSVGP